MTTQRTLAAPVLTAMIGIAAVLVIVGTSTVDVTEPPAHHSLGLRGPIYD